MYSIKEIKNELKLHPLQRIVFPEGNEVKIQQVAQELSQQKLAVPILIFASQNEIPKNLDAKILTVTVDEIDAEKYVAEFMKIRQQKTNLAQATEVMKIRAYIGAMMVKMGEADGMVCGLTFTTADTLRPALQIIKTAPNYALASSVMVMKKGQQSFLFTDCALNIDPNSDQLADIAKMSAQFALDMDVKNPEVVLLSYSTLGSGQGPDVDKVRLAVETLKNQKDLNFKVDGEFQFDAAIDAAVRTKKAPGSLLKKPIPDVFVFPDLQSGNIGYKIAQRLGEMEAAGPFILGLNQPVNDLSRGANFEDILATAIITAFQALKGKKK